METLGDALPKEIERVQEIIKEYESVPGGQFAAAFMKKDIQTAMAAMTEGDVVKMMTIYNELKEWKL